MTTIVEINHNCPQAGPLVEYLASLPFATVKREPQKSFEEAARECSAITVDEFFDEVRRQLNEDYDRRDALC